ncbi:MAG: hypothetical protein RSA01_08695 [Clostridium sp.]|uniref:hypothetical protein n=1 Tax=Clostridium sp. TaxID=1506 RepID=UPI002FCC870C
MIKETKNYTINLDESKKLLEKLREKPRSLEAETMFEMTRVSKIANKIARGEVITLEEERLISDKYPSVKRKAYYAKIEGESIKEKVRCAKTIDEKKKLILSASTNAMLSVSGDNPRLEIGIKLSVIDKICSDENIRLSDIETELSKKGKKVDKRA